MNVAVRLAPLLAVIALSASTVAQPAAAQPASPACASLDACTVALARGAYDDAERGFTALRQGSSRSAATLGLARVHLARGRHDEAARLVRPLSRRGDLRVSAATLLGEALAAQGQLDAAQRAFEAVIGEPTAHRARALLGRLLTRRGRDQAANLVLMRLIEDYNRQVIGPRDAEGLHYVALAAQLLDSPQDANDAYLESTRADASRVETQLDWAELFLSKYDPGHAEESVQQALEQNPESARAHALMARIRLAQSHNFVAARESLERALAINPNLVLAHVTNARIAIREMDLEAAQQHVDRALAVDAHDLEALSVVAALRFLEDDRRAYQRAIRAVLAENAGFSELYTIIADYAEWEHRYPQMVEMAREALRIDPNDATAYATLGINLLRMGDEEDGLEALRQAWRRDRFNVRVHNMLNLYDDVIAPHYESFRSGPFRFRMHRDERPLLEADVTAMLRRAYDEMRRRYRFTPDGPVHMELFTDPEHFSVRTMGLPQAGVQGVCFGQVVTAMSPSAGNFNWGEITWHELAHVFHIQLSNNRVPRWFTEGLAEWEANQARPEWRREHDHQLWLALSADRLPPLSRLNHAFTHARSGEAVMLAYYYSTQVVTYLADRYDFGRLVRMLRGWGRGQTTEQIVRQVFGMPIEQLDREMKAALRQRLAARAQDFAVDPERYRDLEAIRARAAAAPQDLAAKVDLAASLFFHGEEEAEARIAEILQDHPNEPTTLVLAAQLAFAQRDPASARRHLTALFTTGRDGYELRTLEARAALAGQDSAGAIAALEAATRIDPTRVTAWQGLAEIAERDQNTPLRRRALERIVMIDQHDRGSSRALLALLAEAGDWAEVQRVAEMAIYRDPLDAESRRLLAEALLRANRARDALAPADLALALEPREAGPFHLTRAKVLWAMNRRRDAREAAASAIAADANLRAEVQAAIPGR